MLGFRIATLRKGMGFSQKKLAKQINVCASAIGMYEQGRREPSTKTLVVLAKVLGVSLDYLITGSETPYRTSTQPAGALLIFHDDQLSDAKIQLLSEIDFAKAMTALQLSWQNNSK
jgi:transcriptional regulator with XRE-family HTH domain